MLNKFQLKFKCSLRMTRMNKMRNGTSQVGRFGEKTRGKSEVVGTCTEEI